MMDMFEELQHQRIGIEGCACAEHQPHGSYRYDYDVQEPGSSR